MLKGDENLTEEERKAAWEEFENEKKGISNFSEVGELNPNLLLSNINPAQIQVNTSFTWSKDRHLYKIIIFLKRGSRLYSFNLNIFVLGPIQNSISASNWWTGYSSNTRLHHAGSIRHYKETCLWQVTLSAGMKNLDVIFLTRT